MTARVYVSHYQRVIHRVHKGSSLAPWDLQFACCWKAAPWMYLDDPGRIIGTSKNITQTNRFNLQKGLITLPHIYIYIYLCIYIYIFCIWFYRSIIYFHIGFLYIYNYIYIYVDILLKFIMYPICSMYMVYLPTFALKITQLCRKIYHTWSIWVYVLYLYILYIIRIIFINLRWWFEWRIHPKMNLNKNDHEKTLMSPVIRMVIVWYSNWMVV